MEMACKASLCYQFYSKAIPIKFNNLCGKKHLAFAGCFLYNRINVTDMVSMNRKVGIV